MKPKDLRDLISKQCGFTHNWKPEPVGPNVNTETGDGYPTGWPRCPSCGAAAMDGHITCGQAQCNEGAWR